MTESSLRERLRQSLADPTQDLPMVAACSAAMALILVEHEEALSALLIERTTREGGPWSGHALGPRSQDMALPGGRREPRDATLSATAERKTFEEVGLDLARRGERLGRLSDTATMGRLPLHVRPFVYLLAEIPTLSLSAEVSHALWVPLAQLKSGERRTIYRLASSGEPLDFPALDIEGRIVWGLTYRVLDEFFRRSDGLPGGERLRPTH